MVSPEAVGLLVAQATFANYVIAGGDSNERSSFRFIIGFNYRDWQLEWFSAGFLALLLRL